ncbi:MAG TPA: hypothetical protein VM555_01085, partial [Tahibacter sp.]|nr:hypothetical protein [Tahibacter sp.]
PRRPSRARRGRRRADVSEAQLTQTILRARRLLRDDGGDTGCIRTITKFGYHWDCEVQLDTDLPASQPESLPAAARGPEAPEVGAAAAPRTSRRRLPIVFAFAALLFAIGAAVWFFRPSAPPNSQAPPRVPQGALVLPVDSTGSGDDAWVRLGGIDFIGSRLRSAGLPVPPGETTMALIGNLGMDAPDALRQSAGAKWIISSEARQSADGWRVSMQAVDGSGNRHAASASAADVLTALRASTDGLIKTLSLTLPAAKPRDRNVEEILQRAQAAMLENDFDAARRILMAAPTTAVPQAELRFQLAALTFRAGRLQEAESQLRGLLDDESTAGDTALQGRVHYALGAIDMMRDQPADAEREFGLALARLDRREQILEYGKALGGLGGARITQGDIQRGLDDLGEARVLLGQSGDLLALARMNMAYGIAQLHRNRPGKAVPVLAEALAQLEPFGAVNERLHAWSAQVSAYLSLLDYAKATEANEAAHALLPRVMDPLNRAETLLDRWQLLLARGRYTEAEASAPDIDGLDLAAHAGLDGRRDALHAQLALARNDPSRALTSAAAAIAKLDAIDRDGAAEMVLLRQRALIAAGRAAEAPDALRAATKDSPPGVPPPVAIRLARAELATNERARADEYAAALAEAEARDVPAELLAVAKSMVPDLLRSGRIDAAGAMLGRFDAAANRDFDVALLQARLHLATGQAQAWAEALQRSRALAGERTIPDDVQTMPPPVVRQND